MTALLFASECSHERFPMPGVQHHIHWGWWFLLKQVLALRGSAENRGAVGASTCLSIWPLGGVGGEGGCMTPSLQLLSRFLADALLCSSGSPLTLKPFLGTTPEMYAAFPLHLLRDCKNKIRLCLGSAHRSHNDPIRLSKCHLNVGRRGCLRIAAVWVSQWVYFWAEPMFSKNHVLGHPDALCC